VRLVALLAHAIRPGRVEGVADSGATRCGESERGRSAGSCVRENPRAQPARPDAESLGRPRG